MHLLKVERFLRGISQDRLGILTGLGQHTISRIESGKRKPRPAEREAIAHVLEVPPDELFPAQT